MASLLLLSCARRRSDCHGPHVFTCCRRTRAPCTAGCCASTTGCAPTPAGYLARVPTSLSNWLRLSPTLSPFAFAVAAVFPIAIASAQPVVCLCSFPSCALFVMTCPGFWPSRHAWTVSTTNCVGHRTGPQLADYRYQGATKHPVLLRSSNAKCGCTHQRSGPSALCSWRGSGACMCMRTGLAWWALRASS